MKWGKSFKSNSKTCKDTVHRELRLCYFNTTHKAFDLLYILILLWSRDKWMVFASVMFLIRFLLFDQDIREDQSGYKLWLGMETKAYRCLVSSLFTGSLDGFYFCIPVHYNKSVNSATLPGIKKFAHINGRKYVFCSGTVLYCLPERS